MSERDFVPPGAAPVAPGPGWYPDPGNPGQARFWDGHSWTDLAGPPPGPAGPASPPVGSVHYQSQGSGFGPVFYVGVVLAVLAVILGVVVFVGRHAASGGGGESVAIGACRYFVAARLQSPSTAEFSRMEAIAPVSGDQWTVIGTVKADTTTGRVRTVDFTCAVKPVSGRWQLVSLRFPRS